MTAEHEVEQRLSTLAFLPIEKAATGDAKALHDLAHSLAMLGLGHTGVEMTAEARSGNLIAASILGRLAAWYATPQSALTMAAILIGLSDLGATEERRACDLAEGIAWLHRAAEAGSDAAEQQLEKYASDPANADLIAMASRIEKKL